MQRGADAACRRVRSRPLRDGRDAKRAATGAARPRLARERPRPLKRAAPRSIPDRHAETRRSPWRPARTRQWQTRPPEHADRRRIPEEPPDRSPLAQGRPDRSRVPQGGADRSPAPSAVPAGLGRTRPTPAPSVPRRAMLIPSLRDRAAPGPHATVASAPRGSRALCPVVSLPCRLPGPLSRSLAPPPPGCARGLFRACPTARRRSFRSDRPPA